MIAEDTNDAASVVVVARHGERQDYVMRDVGENWVKDAVRPWDPPLSAHGIEQGKRLGLHLAKELKRRNIPPLSVIYSSPFLRCRQTAVAAMKGVNEASVEKVPPARIELGLAESINESWYRSWSLPYSNGTWGLRPKGETSMDPSTLHPASKQPVQELLDWRSTLDSSNSADVSLDFDLNYAGKTVLAIPYCFEPRKLESREDQRQRMLDAVSQVSEPGQAVMVVSHGGPVTHLYEELTGNNWHKHGESSYCCYSIYRKLPGNHKWEPVAVNQSDFLHEKAVYERHISEISNSK